MKNYDVRLKSLNPHALLCFNLCNIFELVAGNSIKRVSGLHSGSFANLVTLELRGNKLETTDGIDLPNLRHLYMVTVLLSLNTSHVVFCSAFIQMY